MDLYLTNSILLITFVNVCNLGISKQKRIFAV